MRAARAMTLAILLSGCFPGKGGQQDTGDAAVLSVEPAVAGQGTSLDVDLGSSQSVFKFGGETSADFGDGITVDEVSVEDGWSATATVTIEADAELGGRDVTVEAGGWSYTLTDGFEVVAESIVVEPDSGKIGETVEVAIAGNNTEWVGGVTWPHFGDGIEILEFSVLSETLATATLSITPEAAPGWRDVYMEDGPDYVALYDGFKVDRVALAATFDPEEVEQGETVEFTVFGRGTDFSSTTDLSFYDIYGENPDIVIDSVTVLDSENLYGQMTVSNAASLGMRDVIVTSGDEGTRIQDAFEVLGGGFSLEEVAISMAFYVDRAIDNSSCVTSESVVAYVMFYIPLDPPCGSSAMGDGPMPYDNNGVYEVPETEEVDCPDPQTIGAGDFVWLESDANTITLERVDDSASGAIYYYAYDLTLDDYVFDNWYDLHTQGEEGAIGEYLLDKIQPTVPADWYMLTPELCENYTHNRAEDFDYTWGVEDSYAGAQTYPDAIFYTSISGTLVSNGKSGFAACYPWDDGVHGYLSSELSQLEASPVYFSAAAAAEGPEFGLPESIYQENVAGTSVALQAYMVLE
ncbi:MAG: hypothetical protein QGG40_04650 [Myxococcota bacterium]|nr:hypothetical protein [Myxococcota bacterium]